MPCTCPPNNSSAVGVAARMLRFVCLFLVITNPVQSAPHLADVKRYLSRFGYLSQSDSNQPISISHAIHQFQEDVGLEPTGKLSRETMQLMAAPRCGNIERSKQASDHRKRRKRFVPHEKKWPRTVLTWRIDDPQNILRPYDMLIVRNAISRAFDKWSSAARYTLRFFELKDLSDTPHPHQADINVFFARGQHNDSLPFDGTDGVVAHGFYPTDGNLHFDADEKWTLNRKSGINLYQTAVHEIGHLLGLQHSADARAVMFPINRPYDPEYKLSDDDVRGIRYLYTPWAWNYYLQRYMHRWRRRNSKSVPKA